MIEESKAMKELHKIREKMHEDTKHMSSLEKVQYIKEKADKAKQRLKLKDRMKI